MGPVISLAISERTIENHITKEKKGEKKTRLDTELGQK